MDAAVKKLVGKIHNKDCIKGMKKIPEGAVDLVFADPPFNIGFEYDQYEDKLESEQYIAWSRDWIEQVHRILKPNGTFWLAIGDEYAAELKVTSQEVGFHCRSWVIWYYTFGVNCKKKFTRSHAHLFHFVKDKNDFAFNHDDLDLRVPSARQLVYNDARANPKGRMPDDTWILRPQDLNDGFNPDEDTWYFPRVAGTFKERAGFHGCQMPEQLLGRIIRACSSSGDVVVDPFSGSSTTLAVAKKLDRQFFGFELSKDYKRLGTKRLESISVGDPLNGAQEPNMSAPKTGAKKNKAGKKSKKEFLPLFPDEKASHDELAVEAVGVAEAFAASNQGFSVDRLVADPVLNEDFQLACDRRSVPGTHAERNRFLFRVRKSGKLKSMGVNTTARTKIDWQQISPFVFGSEIAWRQISNKYCNLGLDEIFCDPRIATQFDRIAAKFAPGYEPLDYRWAALKLRKEGSSARRRATMQNSKSFGIAPLKSKSLAKFESVALADLVSGDVAEGPGVYVVRDANAKAVYAGEAEQLRHRIAYQFAGDQLELWMQRDRQLQICILPVETTLDYRLARQSLLLKWHKPVWNQVDFLAA